MTEDGRAPNVGTKVTAVEDFAASREEYIFDEDDSEHLQDSGEDEEVNRTASLFTDFLNDEDYYAVLGLQRQPPPSDADIRAAYHQLSLTFHPDKHAPERSNSVRKRFDTIQTAYKILLDPQKRSVYDLLGAEGVSQQWSRGGTMSKGGEAETQQIGVRAMSSREFQKWLLLNLKQRERRILESLVESRSLVTIGINAQQALRHNDWFPAIRLNELGLSRFRLRTSYEVPLPRFHLFRMIGLSESTSLEDQEDDEKSESRAFLGEQSTRLTLTAGVAGTLYRPLQEMRVEDENGEVRDRKVLLPPSISTRGLSLGATTQISFPEIDGEVQGWGNKLQKLLARTDVELGAIVLPTRTLFAGFSRPFSPLGGTQPVIVSGKATVQRSLFAMPPMVALGAQRRLGSSSIGYLSWSAGSVFWPSSIGSRLASLIPATPPDQPLQIISTQSSSLTIGFATHPVQDSPEVSDIQTPDTESSKLTPVAPYYSLDVSATPEAEPSLTANYSLYVFRGKQSVQTSPLSSFSVTTYTPPLPPIFPSPPSPLRFTLSTTLTPSGIISYSLKGARPVTPFTFLNLSVSFHTSLGLTLSLTLTRLGQSLSIPIALYPVASTTRSVVSFAIAIPLATYAALDFCMLQPRARRARERALKRFARRIAHVTKKRREEALETVELMRGHVARRQDRERGEGGLVIEEAWWGGASKSGREVEADVTIPLAGMVEKGQLVLRRQVRKGGLMGWWDPCPGREKVLRVRYLFRGEGHEVRVRDGEDLVLPRRRDRREV
ncbi:MAG: hypothetical protein Q9160_003147 [Pyrenula sp. 1 TL-2023]